MAMRPNRKLRRAAARGQAFSMSGPSKIRSEQKYPSGDFARMRITREEVKQFSAGAASVPVYNGTAGQVMVDLTAVTQGVSGAQRSGDHLFLRHLELRMMFYNQYGVTSNLQAIFRVIVFQYFGDSSVAGKPTIADFLQTSAANGGGTYGSFSPYDIDYDRQYKVLWDSELSISTYGTFGAAPLGVPSFGLFKRVCKSISLKRADRNIAFYTGGTTGPNHIFMLVTLDAATIASNPQVYYSTEVRFTDS